jgi:hypothetical protein
MRAAPLVGIACSGKEEAARLARAAQVKGGNAGDAGKPRPNSPSRIRRLDRQDDQTDATLKKLVRNIIATVNVLERALGEDGGILRQQEAKLIRSLPCVAAQPQPEDFRVRLSRNLGFGRRGLLILEGTECDACGGSAREG